MSIVKAKRFLVPGLAALVISAASATALIARFSDQRARPLEQTRAKPSPLPPAFVRARLGRSLSLPAGITLPPDIEPSSVTPHGSFTSLRGESYYIFEGSLRSGTLRPPFDRDSVPLRCVIDIGPRYSGAACGHPLVNSDLFFSEGTEGGPAAGTETRHFISGLCTRRVARIEALDSSGAIEQAQVNESGAFFVELPATALAKGLRFEALRAYDRNGALIEQVDV
jgi:hypothetical protein